MEYLAFLGEWYNLPWLAAVLGGLLVVTLGRRRHETFPWGAAAVAAGVIGLTLNGAIHDLRLGSYARWLPIVIVLALAGGTAIVGLAAWIRARLFPPVTGVTFNQPGLTGTTAVVLNREAGGSDASPARGRARCRSDDGTVHIVRIHLARSDTAAFGRTVRLGEFDADCRSYFAEPV